ncbi:MAG: hypothetical protein AAGM84_05375 [Pseudomonadota bacterium]
MGGIDPDRQADAALEAVDRYGTALAAFSDGHEWMGIAPPSDPADLSRIATVQTAWAAYAPAYHQILAGDRHAVIMSQILRGIDPAVESASTLASYFISAEPGGEIVDPSVVPALRLAARQRLLIQRALRQMCLIHVGLAGPPMRVALIDTLAHIRIGAERLASGNGDVVEPPDARIARNLRTADLFWSKMRPAIKAVASGAGTSNDDIAKVLKFNKSVQKQLVQAVDGYAAAKP